MFSLGASAFAQSQVVNLTAGGRLTINCPTGLTVELHSASKQVQIVCAALAATIVPTVSPTSVTSHDPTRCHAPTTHEHGPCPPQWVESSGLASTFDGTEDHRGFKGMLFPTNPEGVDVYLQVHLISTPSGRARQFHSYKVWMRDPTGAVTYYQGQLNTGDPLTARVPYIQSADGFGIRPVVLVLDQESYDRFGPLCEVWYVFGIVHIGWNICPPVYLHDPTDNPTNPATWTRTPGGSVGNARGVDVSWYPGYQPVGAFTQGGLPQYTAPSLSNYTVNNGYLEVIRVRHDSTTNCPQCVVPN